MSVAQGGGPEAAGLVAELREIVSDLHGELPRNGLVAWTSGNVSARSRALISWSSSRAASATTT